MQLWTSSIRTGKFRPKLRRNVYRFSSNGANDAEVETNPITPTTQAGISSAQQNNTTPPDNIPDDQTSDITPISTPRKARSAFWLSSNELNAKHLHDNPDEEVLGKDSFFYDPENATSEIPSSPLMDEAEWQKIIRRKKDRYSAKAQPPGWYDLSQRERDLIKNPYAAALITPVRRDPITRTRLPSFFLQRLYLARRPAPEKVPTKPPTFEKPWWLPHGLDYSQGNAQPSLQTRHTLANQDHLEYVGNKPKLMGRFVVDMPVDSAIWREDMPSFILKKMQQRVMDELCVGRGAVLSANREDGNWRTRNIGSILCWTLDPPPPPPPRRKIEQDSSTTEQSVDLINTEAAPFCTTTDSVPSDSALQVERLTPLIDNNSPANPTEIPSPPPEPIPHPSTAHLLMYLSGKPVYCFNMPLLIGVDNALALRKRMKIESTIHRSAIAMSKKSTSAQMWLLKLVLYTKSVRKERRR